MRRVRLGALGLVMLWGCGYRFTAPNASLPAQVKTARVPVFMNRTAEPAIEWVFTEAARDQLARAGLLGGGDALAALEGTVLAVSSGPFLQSPTLPRQPVFRLNVSVGLRLKKGDAAVAETVVSLTEEFPSGADVLLTEANRAAALRRVADAAVREGLERLQASAPSTE